MNLDSKYDLFKISAANSHGRLVVIIDVAFSLGGAHFRCANMLWRIFALTLLGNTMLKNR